MLKFIGYLLAAWLVLHWLTAGQSEIVQGPPQGPNPDFCTNCPVK